MHDTMTEQKPPEEALKALHNAIQAALMCLEEGNHSRAVVLLRVAIDAKPSR